MKFLRQLFGIVFLTLYLNLSSLAVDLFVNPLFLNLPNITLNTFGSLKEAFQNIDIYYINDEIFNIYLTRICSEDVDFSYVLSKNFTITAQDRNSTSIFNQNASISLVITGSLRIENISFDGMNSKKPLSMIVTENASIFLKVLNCYILFIKENLRIGNLKTMELISGLHPLSRQLELKTSK